MTPPATWHIWRGIVTGKWYASGPFLKQFDSFHAAWEWIDQIRHQEPS